MNKNANWYKNKLEYMNEYNRNNYDRLNLTIPKGQKNYYKNIAAKCNLSLSQLFMDAIDEYAKNHNL